MGTQREHRTAVQVVQGQMASLELKIGEIQSQTEKAAIRKQKAIETAMESGVLPETDAINQAIFTLQSQKEDAGAVLAGLQGKLGEVLGEYRGHLVERQKAEVDRILKQIEETLQLIQNYRIELAKLFMTLSGRDAYGTSMNSPKEFRTSPITYEYSHLPVPQALVVAAPPFDYDPKDFRRLEREIQEELKALRAIEKMSAEQLLDLSKSSD